MRQTTTALRILIHKIFLNLTFFVKVQFFPKKSNMCKNPNISQNYKFYKKSFFSLYILLSNSNGFQKKIPKIQFYFWLLYNERPWGNLISNLAIGKCWQLGIIKLAFLAIFNFEFYSILILYLQYFNIIKNIINFKKFD